MDIIGLNIPDRYFKLHAGDTGIKAAQKSFSAWHLITDDAEWSAPQQVQAAHPKASILKAGRVVFNVKGNDFRLICKVDYASLIVSIRWFGTHAEYDKVDAETV